VAVSTEKCGYGNVKTFAAVLACAPYSSSSVIDIKFSQFIVAFLADEFAASVEVFFYIHVSAFNVFNKGAFLDVK